MNHTKRVCFGGCILELAIRIRLIIEELINVRMMIRDILNDIQ